ncbi:MAG: hypothetical protein FJ297_04940 [Planctomycetes bacterium]|nr:hypothetical protein [Planctomycetota bacterium]
MGGMTECSGSAVRSRPGARRAPLAAAVVLIAAIWAPTSEPVGAQDESINNKFLPPPRALHQRLTRGRQAVKDQQYNVAVDELGGILSPEPGPDADADVDQDYFIVGEAGSGAMPSLKAEAQRLIGAMPAQGRELYELRYGALARAMLEEAVAGGDLHRLTEVTRRYFHTRAGYEAMLLLGRYHMDEGRQLAAALCFERLAANPAAVAALDPELSVLLAACRRYAGPPEKSIEGLIALRARDPNASLRIGGEDVRIFQEEGQASAWLTRVLGRMEIAPPQGKTEWALFRGDASRNARAEGGTPVMNHRWLVPTANDPADEELVREHLRQLGGSDGVLIPSLQPLAVRQTILMRTPRRLMAVDLDSGKRIWEFPWDDGPDELAGRSLDLPLARGGGNPRMLELGERLWRDAAYGQISSDGELVYLLHDLSYAMTAGNPTFVGPGGLPQANDGWPKPHNKLVAVSLAREGALQWVVGGDDGADEPALANAFFLGPPLPVMGQLFALAEIVGELRLVALHPRTGKLEWQQQLAHVDAATIDFDPLRRLAGATPSFADGVLVCPTSAGAVVSLDVSNRSLLWGFQYGTAPGPGGIHAQRFNFNRAIAAPSEESWIDATATIVDRKVLVTPVESDELYCLDLLTGAPLWNARKRDGALYVACVHNGNAVLVGKHAVAAVALKDGSLAWTKPIELLQESVCGRGFHTDAHYYLPTSGSRLHRIDLNEGRIVETIATRAPLGNLVCHRDQILSQGVDRLGAYHQFEPLSRWVAERLAANPADREALARKCDLLLQEGKRKEALDTMWLTYEADRSDETIRAHLVRTFLEALDEDFESYAPRAADVEPLIEQPAQRTAYLRLVSSGRQRAGDLAGAFEAVLRLADEDRDESGLSEPALERVDRQWSVTRDRWVRGRVASLLAAAGGDAFRALREDWDNEVTRRLDAALESASRAALRRFLEQFASHPLAAKGRLRYARMLFESNELLPAELQLSGLLADPSADIAREAAGLMAMTLLKGQKLNEARQWYESIERQWPDAVVVDGQTGRQLMESARGQPAMVAAQAADRPWPRTRATTETGFDPQRGSPFPSVAYPVQIQEARGPWPEGTTVTIDSRSNSVQIRDASGRDVQSAMISNSGPSFANMYNLAHGKANGHLIVINAQTEVLAVDAMRGSQDPQESILWRHDLTESIPNAVQRRLSHKTLRHPWRQTGVRVMASDYSQARVPQGAIGPVTSGGVCFQRFRQLVCVDPLTGTTVWSRDGVEPGAQLFGDEDLLFVVPYDQTEAIVLSASTGEWLGQRPIDKLENRWATWGRHVLAWSEGDGQLTLRVHDPWSGQDLWRGLFPVGSRGELVGDDEVAVFQATGELVVVSLRDGAERLRTTLEPVAAPAHLFVQRYRDAYHVLPGAGITADPNVSITAPSVDTATPVLRGKLYALQAGTGDMLWQTPGEIESFSIPLIQPARSPVLVLVRSMLFRTGQSRAQASVLCVDKRDGRILYSNDEFPAQPGANLTYDISSDPKTNSVYVALAGHAVTLRFLDEPPPPAPTVRTDGAGAN